MPKEITQEIIDQYLNQQLSGDQLDAFEAKLNNDPDFKKEIEMQAFIHRGANKLGQDEMHAKLKKIRAEVLHTPAKKTEEPKAKVVPLGQKKKIRSLLRWGMAAAIALAIGASIYIIANHQTMSTDDLYANYYQPYTEEITVRGDNTNASVQEVTQLYKDKKYREALPAFLRLLAAEPDNAELQLVVGICQLELDNFDKASQSFSSVTNPLYKDQAQWYLAMTFLKQNDLASAGTILKTIQSGDFNYQKAQEILEQM